MIGQKFGRWTVLEQAPSRNHKKYWTCQCECGTIREVLGTDLRNGKSRSCGCLTRESAQKKKKDLTGQKFGRLTVIADTGERKNEKVIWLCQCECGNMCKIISTQLISGKTQSCGCLQKERTSEATRLDLTGMRFGSLVVIEPAPNKESSKETQWRCKCDCGNEKIVTTHLLQSGHTTSCGCLRISKGENKIIQLLTKYNIPFVREYKFSDLWLGEGAGQRQARFDFYVNNTYLIEFDGIQHFKIGQGYFDNPEKFYRTQQYDTIKTNYCLEHKIPLIRIPYSQLEQLNIQDLLLETSSFIIKEKQEDK